MDEDSNGASVAVPTESNGNGHVPVEANGHRFAHLLANTMPQMAAAEIPVALDEKPLIEEARVEARHLVEQIFPHFGQGLLAKQYALSTQMLSLFKKGQVLPVPHNDIFEKFEPYLAATNDAISVLQAIEEKGLMSISSDYCRHLIHYHENCPRKDKIFYNSAVSEPIIDFARKYHHTLKYALRKITDAEKAHEHNGKNGYAAAR